MSGPRVDVDLVKIRHNARTAVDRLAARGINTTGVTKGVCGHPAIARAMLDGGVRALAEARLGNVQRLRRAGITCPITLIRTPMQSQAEQVVLLCEASYNTDMGVIAALAGAARRAGKVHQILLMIEMGDLREGILPGELAFMAAEIRCMQGVVLSGLGANFACLGGIGPQDAAMAALSALAARTQASGEPVAQTVSGGNSASLPWVMNPHPVGRINDLRLGEAILMGVDPLTGTQIAGMHTDAFTLIAEIIEARIKPVPIGAGPAVATPRVILALGHQDTQISGLTMPRGCTLIGATSDHLVLGTSGTMPEVGTEMRFHMTYGALMRAMAAPDIGTRLLYDGLPAGRTLRGTSRADGAPAPVGDSVQRHPHAMRNDASLNIRL